MNKFRESTPSRSEKSINDYRDAFKDLRKDFRERCGYCDVSDKYLTINYFEIDHYKPKSKFNHLKHEYCNLIYSCKNCNNFKGAYWATDDENIEVNTDSTEGLMDPCTEEYTNLFERNSRGYIIPTNNSISQFIYRKLKLYLFKKAFYFNIEETDNKILQILAHRNKNKLAADDFCELLKIKSDIQSLVNNVELSYKLKK